MFYDAFLSSFYWKFPAPNAEEIIKKIEEYGDGDVDNSLFSWRRDCVVDLIPLRSEEWIELIRPSLKHISNLANADYDYVLWDPWISFYKRNSFQELHDHDAYDMSFVFFANDGEGFSRFMFLDRNSTSLSMHMKQLVGYFDAKYVNYKKGDIVFFPSNQLHGVTQHHSDVTRKTLVGNITIENISPKPPEQGGLTNP